MLHDSESTPVSMLSAIQQHPYEFLSAHVCHNYVHLAHSSLSPSLSILLDMDLVVGLEGVDCLVGELDADILSVSCLGV